MKQGEAIGITFEVSPGIKLSMTTTESVKTIVGLWNKFDKYENIGNMNKEELTDSFEDFCICEKGREVFWKIQKNIKKEQHSDKGIDIFGKKKIVKKLKELVQTEKQCLLVIDGKKLFSCKIVTENYGNKWYIHVFNEHDELIQYLKISLADIGSSISAGLVNGTVIDVCNILKYRDIEQNMEKSLAYLEKRKEIIENESWFIDVDRISRIICLE